VKESYAKQIFISLKLNIPKRKNPTVWWKEIKRICGAQRNTTTLTDHIQDEVVKNLSAKEIADAINKAFLME
jgi:signal recognition particle subunit SEC65